MTARREGENKGLLIARTITPTPQKAPLEIAHRTRKVTDTHG
jgi:hypothetical protein